jgi:hypothetical protein
VRYLYLSVEGSKLCFSAICASTIFSPGCSDSIAASTASIELILVDLFVGESLVLHAGIGRYAIQ